MTSPQTGIEEKIGIQEASEKLGLSPSFLNWALDSGLLKGHRDKSGDWKLNMGDLDQAAAVLHREAPALKKAAESSARIAHSLQPEWPAEPADGPEPEDSLEPAAPAAILEIPARPQATSAPALPSAAASIAPETGVRSNLDAVYEDQVDYLRRQLTQREGAIGEKDSLIVQLTDRVGQLGETAIARLPIPGAQIPVAAAAPAAPADQGLEIAAEQQAINERQDEALANIRETLLMVRNYLAQLAPDENNKDT